jgi:transposase
MEKRIKQSVGIDCGLKELVVSYGVMDEHFDIKILSNTQFKNEASGFKKLVAWSKQLNPEKNEVVYVIEATGVYHERAALYLHQQGCKVVVLLPNKAKAFAKTLSVKTVNDKVSAQMLAQMGLEKKLDAWQPPQKVFNDLKQLTRERDQLMSEQTAIKNQLHAETSGAWVKQQSVKRMKYRLKILAKQMEEIENEMAAAIEKESWLKEKVKKICTIKGVGLTTVATVLAETNGFNLIRNKKQLASYAGLDVVERQSGISIKGKTRISRKGNKYLRKCLHYPALTAIRHNETMKVLFDRLVSKHGIKMKAAVAVQRKLLELIYILWKKDEVFDENYQHKNKKEQPLLTALAN